MAAAAFVSVFIGHRLCHSRGARWYSYGGRLFHVKKRYLKFRYLYFAPPDSFRRAAFGFGFAFLIIQAARPLAFGFALAAFLPDSGSRAAAVGFVGRLIQARRLWLRLCLWLRPLASARRKKNCT